MRDNYLKNIVKCILSTTIFLESIVVNAYGPSLEEILNHDQTCIYASLTESEKEGMEEFYNSLHKGYINKKINFSDFLNRVNEFFNKEQDKESMKKKHI